MVFTFKVRAIQLSLISILCALFLKAVIGHAKKNSLNSRITDDECVSLHVVKISVRDLEALSISIFSSPSISKKVLLDGTATQTVKWSDYNIELGKTEKESGVIFLKLLNQEGKELATRIFDPIYFAFDITQGAEAFFFKDKNNQEVPWIGLAYDGSETIAFYHLQKGFELKAAMTTAKIGLVNDDHYPLLRFKFLGDTIEACDDYTRSRLLQFPKF